MIGFNPEGSVLPDSSEDTACPAPKPALQPCGTPPSLPNTRLAPRYRAGGHTVGALALPGMPDDDALRVHAAIPDGYRLSPTRGRWLAHVDAHPDIARRRPEAREFTLAVCYVLARYADNQTLITRPGHRLIADLLGLDIDWDAKWDSDRRRLLRVLQWLRQHALIAHVERGSTEQYRHGPSDGAGARAAVYALLVPETRRAATTVTPSPPSEKVFSSTRETELSTPNAALRAAGSQDEDSAWPATAVTCGKRDRWAAATALRNTNPVLARISMKHLASMARPWLQAGWCIRDLLHALDHRPDGTPHPYAFAINDIEYPPGWVAARWRAWTDAAGAPLPSPRTARERERDQAHHDLERFRAAVAEQRQAAAHDPRVSPDTADAVASPAEHKDRAAVERRTITELRAEREARERARLYAALPDAPPATVDHTDDRQRSDEIRRRAIARARTERSTR